MPDGPVGADPPDPEVRVALHLDAQSHRLSLGQPIGAIRARLSAEQLNFQRKVLSHRPGRQVHAGRVMKFTSAKDITAKAATIKAYVRQAIAVEKAGLRMKRKKTSDSPVPEELRERLRSDPRFKRAFEALTPGRQRSYLYHFAAAKQSATRVARIEKAMPAIFEGRGFLERR